MKAATDNTPQTHFSKVRLTPAQATSKTENSPLLDTTGGRQTFLGRERIVSRSSGASQTLVAQQTKAERVQQQEPDIPRVLTLQGVDPQNFEKFVKQMEDVTATLSQTRKLAPNKSPVGCFTATSKFFAKGEEGLGQRQNPNGHSPNPVEPSGRPVLKPVTEKASMSRHEVPQQAGSKKTKFCQAKAMSLTKIQRKVIVRQFTVEQDSEKSGFASHPKTQLNSEAVSPRAEQLSDMPKIDDRHKRQKEWTSVGVKTYQNEEQESKSYFQESLNLPQAKSLATGRAPGRQTQVDWRAAERRRGQLECVQSHLVRRSSEQPVSQIENDMSPVIRKHAGNRLGAQGNVLASHLSGIFLGSARARKSLGQTKLQQLESWCALPQNQQQLKMLIGQLSGLATSEDLKAVQAVHASHQGLLNVSTRLPDSTNRSTSLAKYHRQKGPSANSSNAPESSEFSLKHQAGLRNRNQKILKSAAPSTQNAIDSDPRQDLWPTKVSRFAAPIDTTGAVQESTMLATTCPVQLQRGLHQSAIVAKTKKKLSLEEIFTKIETSFKFDPVELDMERAKTSFFGNEGRLATSKLYSCKTPSNQREKANRSKKSKSNAGDIKLLTPLPNAFSPLSKRDALFQASRVSGNPLLMSSGPGKQDIELFPQVNGYLEQVKLGRVPEQRSENALHIFDHSEQIHSGHRSSDTNFKDSISQLKHAMRIKPDVKPIAIVTRHRLTSTARNTPKNQLKSPNRVQEMAAALNQPSDDNDNSVQRTSRQNTPSGHNQSEPDLKSQPSAPSVQRIAELKRSKQPKKEQQQGFDPGRLERLNRTNVGFNQAKLFSHEGHLPQFTQSDFRAQAKQVASPGAPAKSKEKATASLHTSRKISKAFKGVAKDPYFAPFKFASVPKAAPPDSAVSDLFQGGAGPSASTVQSPKTPYKEGLASIIKRQLIAAQLAQEKQQVQRQLKAVQMRTKRDKIKNQVAVETPTEQPLSERRKVKGRQAAAQKSRPSLASAFVSPSNSDLLENRLACKAMAQSPELLSFGRTPLPQYKGKQKPMLKSLGSEPGSKAALSDADLEDVMHEQPALPKYQVREEVLNESAQPSSALPVQSATVARAKSKEPQQVVNAQKYEQLMAQSFIPELSILEKRITELSKMPDQMRHYLQRSKQQQQNGVTSILKPSEESGRLLLKQREGKDGSKMLVAARNESLSRFTQELKQPKGQTQKKVTLNLSPTLGKPGSLLDQEENAKRGQSSFSGLKGQARENLRKKVNFDLPQIGGAVPAEGQQD